MNGLKIDEQYMRVSQMMVQYYRDTPVKPTFKDWQQWIDSLDEPMKRVHFEDGFEKSKTALPFIRFYSELHDFGMRDYMREKLNREDLNYYLKVVEKV